MHNKYGIHILILVFSVFITYAPISSAQSYGLKFKGMGESLDNRTELNLTPNGYLNFQDEFEISFDYKTTRLYPNSNRGLFGYIFRVINRDNNNVDLIHSITDSDLNLNIVMGKSDSIVKANYPESAVNNWIRLRVKFDLSEDRLIFYTHETFYVLEEVGFKNNDEFKIIFGINSFNQFKTSDVPTMQIKDLKISEHGKLKYHWPLDEKEGNRATDRIKNRKAIIKNPSWLNHGHQIWQPKFENEFNGLLMVAADTENDKMFFVGSDELLIYSVADNDTQKVVFKNKPEFLTPDYKAIYNSQDQKIYCYLVEEETPYVLDINTGIWNTIDPVSTLTTNYRHHNRFYYPADNSILLFGGYGQHRYNNEVRKLYLDNITSEKLPTDPAVFHPKYLAGLGALNDTIYLLGGYGSKSGNQLINPQSYYDLIGYSIQDNTFFKKFEIPHIIDDMCVANSMWIDGETRDYYALVFEKSKFDGHLQLIKGNLDSPNVEFVGDKFHFQFLDIRSSAGLFYMRGQKKLVAYTTYVTDSVTTKTAIHTINYPPNPVLDVTEEAEKSKRQSYLYAALGVVVIIVLIYLFSPKRRRKNLIKSDTPDKDAGEKLNIVPTDILIDKTEYQLIFFWRFSSD